jgi:hypothetical protein
MLLVGLFHSGFHGTNRRYGNLHESDDFWDTDGFTRDRLGPSTLWHFLFIQKRWQLQFISPPTKHGTLGLIDDFARPLDFVYNLPAFAPMVRQAISTKVRDANLE